MTHHRSVVKSQFETSHNFLGLNSLLKQLPESGDVSVCSTVSPSNFPNNVKGNCWQQLYQSLTSLIVGELFPKLLYWGGVVQTQL